MSLQSVITTQFSAVETAAGDLRSGSINTTLAKQTRTLADGSGLNQANRLFADTATLAAEASASLDLFDFSGAKDAQGQSFALTKVKAIILRNKASDATAILRVGGEGSTAAFMAVNGSDTIHIADIGPGGEMALLAPSGAGYAVADTSNHLLKIANQSTTASAEYDIVVVGAQ